MDYDRLILASHPVLLPIGFFYPSNPEAVVSRTSSSHGDKGQFSLFILRCSSGTFLPETQISLGFQDKTLPRLLFHPNSYCSFNLASPLAEHLGFRVWRWPSHPFFLLGHFIHPGLLRTPCWATLGLQNPPPQSLPIPFLPCMPILCDLFPQDLLNLCILLPPTICFPHVAFHLGKVTASNKTKAQDYLWSLS